MQQTDSPKSTIYGSLYGLLYFFGKNYDSLKIGLLTSRTKLKIRLELPLHGSLKKAILLLQKNQFRKVPANTFLFLSLLEWKLI